MVGTIIFTIICATLISLLLKKFHIAAVIAYVAAGSIISFSFHLHDAVHAHHLKQITQLGVVFLVFAMGLGFSINHLGKTKKEVFLYGGSQLVLTAAIFTFAGNLLLGIELKPAVIIGLALAFSSTAALLGLLNENLNTNKIYGGMVLGVFMFQNIVAIPILLTITLFSTASSSLSSLLIETFIDAAILFAGLFIIGKYFLEPFFLLVTKTKSSKIFINAILLFAAGSSYIAHKFGFSYSLGAFIAGMMIAQTRYKPLAETGLIPLRNLILGIFFITVGMQLDFKVIIENISSIALILPAVTAIKLTVIYSIMRFGTGSKTAFKNALSLFQLGEFTLVILVLSFAGGIIEPQTGQILIASVVVSIILIPFVLGKFHISQITGKNNNTRRISGD